MQGTQNTAALLGPRRDEPALHPWRLGQIACAGGDAGDARQPSSADGEVRLDARGVVELGGGLAILFGLLTRPVGLVLAIWCVATSLIAHTNLADRNQEIHFLKNMAMMGGFLYVAAFGGGAWSLDARWSSRGVSRR
jgi:putative oxidoreductase